MNSYFKEIENCGSARGWPRSQVWAGVRFSRTKFLFPTHPPRIRMSHAFEVEVVATTCICFIERGTCDKTKFLFVDKGGYFYPIKNELRERKPDSSRDNGKVSHILNMLWKTYV